MIDFHLIVFLEHQNPGLATEIVFLGSLFQSYYMFNTYSLIMLICANHTTNKTRQIWGIW